MQKNLPAIFAFTMQAEGGASVSLDPEDSGNWSSGECGIGRLIGSKYGCSAPDLIRYMAPALVTAQTMANMTQDTAEAIWQSGYAQSMRLSDLPAGADLMVGDSGYNRGVSAAGRILQRTLGFKGSDVDGWIGDDTVHGAFSAGLFPFLPSPNATSAVQARLGVYVDGDFGPESQAALKKVNSARALILCAQLADAQAQDYRTLAQFPRYGNGWIARTWGRLTAALALVTV